METDLLNYVSRLSYKKCGKKDFTDDVVQEVLIKCITQGIHSLKGNELQIHKWIIYHLNMEKRKGMKLEEFRIELWIAYMDKVFIQQRLTDEFNKFVLYTDICGKDLQDFHDIKFERKSYKELGLSTKSAERVRIRRVLIKFGEYLNEKGLNLTDFYE